MANSFQSYKWSLNLLKEVSIWVHNFVWTGDVNKVGLVIVN